MGIIISNPLVLNDIQLLISIPSSGRKGEWPLMKWLWYTCMNAPFYIAWNTFEGRPEDDARNGIAQHFLKNPTDNFSFRPRPKQKQLHYTHLMMIDDDILPPPNAFEMVLHNKSVVSAVVFTWREGAPLALIMKWDEEKQGYRQDKEAINKLNQGERLVKVDASGTGCFVVKREVYENLVSNWFRFQYDETGRCSLSEDFHFYQRLREIGYSTWIDGKVVCGHIGSVNIQEIQNLLVGASLPASAGAGTVDRSPRQAGVSGSPSVERAVAQGFTASPKILPRLEEGK